MAASPPAWSQEMAGSDPARQDCELPENEFLFHVAAIYATGDMVLSADGFTTISAPRIAMLGPGGNYPARLLECVHV